MHFVAGSLAFTLLTSLTFGQEAPASDDATEPASEAADQTDRTREVQAPVAPAPSDASATDAAGQAKAAFDAKFEEYKQALREIEQLRTQFQTADADGRKKLNEQLTGHLAHAQSLINGVVDAASEAYRFAPNADPQITALLTAVAEHHAIGRQAETQPGQTDGPSSGGDQYEKALPIIKLLSEGGAEAPDLPVWGFLCAFVTNDYDLAEKYLQKAIESGAFQETAGASNPARQRAKETAMGYAEMLDQYRTMWAKEAEIRAKEAAADDLPSVKLTTTKGEITLELFENEAPQSVANFLTLVKEGFYNGSPFHRVLPVFMAQGGAKTDDGQGGPGYTIRCECYEPDARMHFRGSLSMAHAGKDTGSSQFFLTFVPTTHLDGKHTVFGRVIEGMEVLGDLTRRNPQSPPPHPTPDRIIKAEVLRDRGHEYSFERLPER
jgi:cyclophilin family peptidyl-prolyl cis-trans isomerase